MPGVRKKDLYLGHSMGDLNSLAGKIPEVKNVRLCVTSAQKLFKTAEETELLGDEEKAYVLYMKFFNFISAIKKTVEYKKDEKYYKNLIGMKNLLKAMDEAERLSESIKIRYEEKEAEAVSKKLEALDANKEEDKSTTDIPEPVISEDKQEPKADEVSSKPDERFMSVQQLYSLLQDGGSSILIMDVRTEEQFSESHISHRCCINVPATIIAPGSTVNKIELALPEASTDLWSRRALMDFIMMVDWTGAESDLQMKAPMKCLKDALYKWDQDTIIKSEPLVLKGGYNDLLLFYPMLTTNARVTRLLSESGSSTLLPSLDAIDYDLDLNFLKSPEELALEEAKKKSENIENTNDKYINNQPFIPSVDRSLKPNGVMATNKDKQEVPSNKDINSQINKGMTKSAIPKISNKLNDLRVELINSSHKEDPVKNTNITKQGTVEIPKSSLPTINRTLKPSNANVNVESPDENTRNDTMIPPSNDRSGEKNSTLLTPSQEDTASDDMRILQQDNQRLILEHRARIAKLKTEQENMIQLKELKSKEVRETASLMRTKKQIQEEIEELELLLQEREKRMAAEDEKWVDLQIRRQQEQEAAQLKNREPQKKSNLDMKANKSVPHESTKSVQERESLEKKLAEQRTQDQEKEEQMLNERRKQELLRKEEENQKHEAERVRREREKEAAAREDSLRKEQEKKTQQEQELKLKARQEQELRMKAKQEQELREKARQEQELRAKARQEQEIRAKAKQEQELREKAKQEQELREKQKVDAEATKAQQASRSKLVTPGLQAGWEKRLDPSTGRYYYIDHKTRKTQWEPPQLTTSQSVTPSPTLYKTQLKDEDTAPSGGGLKRSHSSPNIVKMMTDEEAKIETPHPMVVDRQSKPKPRPENKPMILQTEVSAAKVRNLQPIWGSMGRGLTGLKNLGNTCYMNSIIQCLSNTAPLTTYILTDSYRGDINRENIFGKGGEVAEEFAVLIKALWSAQYKSVSPRDFKMTVAKYHELFAGYSQQDSQELLLFLMDGLHEDLNRVVRRKALPEQDNDNIPDDQAATTAWRLHKTVNESVIVELFQGQFKSTVRCLHCDKKSVTFDAFMYLTLPIPSSTRCTLKECLLHFSREEKMTGESRWHCPRCKTARDAVKQIVIWKLPPILLIHLKRFYYQGMWRQKIASYVDFPLDDLDLSNYIAGSPTRKPFSLYGVSNHYGSLDGGHYTAYCKNPTAQKWYKYDDHEVYKISTSDIKTSAAYILFYTSIGMTPLFK